MTMVNKMMEQFTEVVNKKPMNRTKRKLENTTDEEEGEMEEQEEGEEMSIEDETTKLRRRVAVTQEALEALEIKRRKGRKK